MVRLLESRYIRWLVWLLVALDIMLIGVGLALQVITKSTLGKAPYFVIFSEALALCAFAIIGALIVSRHPQHPIGWIWILLSFSFGADHFAWGYAYYGYIAHPGSLPAAEAAIVWLYWLGRGNLGILALTLLLLLFPTGRPLSPRWRLIAWITVGDVVVSIPISVFAANPTIYFPFPTDLLPTGDLARAVLAPIRNIISLLGLLCVIAAMFSLFLRFLRSRGVERQQIKWFAYTAAFLPLAIGLISLSFSLQPSSFNWITLLGATLAVIVSSSMAIASTVAIFRYRLWDIDLIIRRTLIYSTLTAALSLVYLSSVLILQSLFRILIGGRQSDFATVISTLAIVALFVPLRQRVQNFIDRRFYRRKYDVEQVLAAFSSTLRDEMDMDRLIVSILDVVEETMQPTHTSLWFRDPRHK